MEQIFDEQCKEDSRLARKLIFIAKNIFKLKPVDTSICHPESAQDVETPKPIKQESHVEPKKIILVSVACSYCKQKFQRSRRYIRKGKPNYCSGLCKDKASIDRCSVKLNCYSCGSDFLMPRNHYNSAKRKDKVCCSKACSNRARPRKAEIVELTCTFCGTQFERNKRLHKEDRPHFCSVRCRAKNDWSNSGLAKAAAALSQVPDPKDCQ